jgi:MFS family permease
MEREMLFDINRIRSSRRLLPVALRHRNYLLFWIGSTISLFGDMVQTTAQGWLVADLTDSPAAVSNIFAVNLIPTAVLVLVGGVYADRFDRRKSLMAFHGLRLVLAATMAVLVYTQAVRVWHIYALALCWGIVRAFSSPVYKSLIASLVPRESLQSAYALNSASYNLMSILGRMIGGIIVGFVGMAQAFASNAISFIAPIATLAIVQAPFQASAKTRQDRRSLREDLRQGLSFLRARRKLATFILLVAGMNFLGQPSITLAPIFARDVIKGGPTSLGYIMAAWSAGLLIGALSAGAVKGMRSLPRVFIVCSLGAGACLIAYATSTHLLLTAAVLVLLGTMVGLREVAQTTLVIAQTPDNLRGRMMSLNTFIASLSLPVSNMIAGALAEQFGVQWFVRGAGILSILLVLATVRAVLEPSSGEESVKPDPVR